MKVMELNEMLNEIEWRESGIKWNRMRIMRIEWSRVKIE